MNYGVIISALITATAAIVTFKLTQSSNLKLQKEQHKHQKELAIIEHSSGKRTEYILEFRKVLEQCLSVLNYFHTEKADFERREILRAQYRNTHVTPRAKADIIPQSITIDNMNNMLNYALQQISPIEDKLLDLNTSFHLLSVYLSEEEEKIFSNLVNEVQNLSHLIINGLRHYKEKGNPMDVYVLGFVHINEPYVPRLNKLNKKVREVRIITKKYVYVHKLEE